jgi:hypothetical protein
MTGNLPAVRDVPTELDMHRATHKRAAERALKWMDEIVAHHERAARDLREHIEAFRRCAAAERHGEEGGATTTQVLSWFVNSTKHVAINARLDLAVDHGAALAVVASKLNSKEV